MYLLYLGVTHRVAPLSILERVHFSDEEKKEALLKLKEEKSILEDAGRISHQLAVQKAGQEYTQYKEVQRVSERLNSIKELDEDIKRLKRKDTDTGKKE